MDIVYGESNLIDARAPLSEVHHDSSLTGKGTKSNKLRAHLVVGDSLAGDGTANSPLQIVPDGVLTDEEGNYLMTENNEFIVPEDWVPSVTGGIYWTGTIGDFIGMANDEELIPGAKYLVTDPYTSFWENTHRLLYTALTTSLVEEEAYGLFADPDYSGTGNYADTPTLYNNNLGLWYSDIVINSNGDVVIYNNKHYMVTTDGSINGSNPADNVGAYTALSPGNELNYGYQYVWNKCWVDKNPNNTTLHGRMDSLGNYVHNIGGRNPIDPVPHFQWGNLICYNNILINSIFSDMFNVRAEISGLKLNEASILNITTSGNSNYFQTITMESGSTIQSVTLTSNSEFYDISLRQGAYLGNIVIGSDARISSICLEQNAGLNNIELGASSSLSEVYLAPEVSLTNKTILEGEEASSKSFFSSNESSLVFNNDNAPKVFNKSGIKDFVVFLSSQGGTDSPSYFELTPFTFDQIDSFDRTDVGEYTMTLVNGIANGPVIGTGALTLPGFITVSSPNPDTIIVNTYDSSGTPSDDILSGTEIVITIYNPS